MKPLSIGRKLIPIAGILVGLLFLSPQRAFAHQPNLVGNVEIEIKDPEISRAFYGTLEGSPHLYLVNSPTRFQLYLNLLVPKLENWERDFTLEIFKVEGGKEIKIDEINSRDFPWSEFYEKFAGDYYYMGPEWEKEMDAGTYRISVSTPNPKAKYVLAVGKIESFPFSEMFRTMGVLPALKVNFFEGSFFDLYKGIIGKFLLGFTILVPVLLALFVFLLARRRRRKTSGVVEAKRVR